ncbi:ribonuclease HII [[Limnothrix rosea] IAM M-220]|uniref:ribonuclease HII n=1 Tax=[Limnothrix rosea] IAM M-220 TaxID=454133 RepID=UPI00095DF0F8|nr:ribonuclease HII [[Limnothrix rosea] IAM M-220]OKH16053.1 ribonuclease HII [[Limnothrix rosea] IAM M-220]
MPLIAGVDEVGRGCLFGSVFAAVVVISPEQERQLWDVGVKDSKKLSEKKRELLVPHIKDIVTDWAIASASVAEIDEINILQATFLAMGRAVENLKIKPDHCLIDGNKLIPNFAYSQEALVKGDAKSGAIAAASILAKVARDQEIIALAETYPQYDLASNKGYGTKKHRQAILQYGLTSEHRQSFKIKELKQLSLKLD